MQVSFAHSWEEDERELRLRVPLGTAPRAALDVYGAPLAARAPHACTRPGCASPALTCLSRRAPQ